MNVKELKEMLELADEKSPVVFELRDSRNNHTNFWEIRSEWEETGGYNPDELDYFNGSKRKATVELTIAYTDDVLKSMREFTEKEREDLIDALAEWNEVVEPKELHPDETGLDSARYHNILNKLRAWE
jgi:hypothetical protein